MFCEETSLTSFCYVNRFRYSLAVPIGLDLFLNREDKFSAFAVHGVIRGVDRMCADGFQKDRRDSKRCMLVHGTAKTLN
jgi:hypothetical protein